MNQNQTKAERLQEMQRKFALGRQSGEIKGNFYPLVFRALVVTAIQQGASKHEVIQAAGISWGSIINWLPAAPKAAAVREPMLRPIKLRVVKCRSAKITKKLVMKQMPAPSPVAQIHFRGGARMEVPISALNFDLLMALNGGAQ